MMARCARLRTAALALLVLPALVRPSPAKAVKIGVLTDMSGIVADATGAGSVVAAQLAVEDVGGTVLGQPVEIVSADDQLKPDVAGAIARRWFDQEHVDAVVDLVVTSIALAVQQLGRDKNKIVLITGAGSQVLLGTNCTPTSFIWVFDTALQSRTAVLAAPGRGTKWFILVPAYSYGVEMEALLRGDIAAQGSVVVGSMPVAFGNADFSSAILSAQSSGANVVAFAQAGHDASNLVRQAHEFGLASSGQKLVAALLFITDVNAIGLSSIDGLFVPTTFCWDADDVTRAFSKRFANRVGRPIRADGRLVRDMYLMQVKAPEESHGPWDYYRVVRHIPAGELQSAAPNADCRLN